jgi:hypothetical protein
MKCVDKETRIKEPCQDVDQSFELISEDDTIPNKSVPIKVVEAVNASSQDEPIEQ